MTPDRRREADVEFKQVEDDIEFFHQLSLHNKQIARERIAEYRAKHAEEESEWVQ